MVERLPDPEMDVDGQPTASSVPDADESPVGDYRRLVEGPDQPAAGQWENVGGRAWR